MDHEKLSDTGISEFLTVQKNPEILRLKIECEPDAKHPGGLNLFGKGFGDFDQNNLVCLFSSEDLEENSQENPG